MTRDHRWTTTAEETRDLGLGPRRALGPPTGLWRRHDRGADRAGARGAGLDHDRLDHDRLDDGGLDDGELDDGGFDEGRLEDGRLGGGFDDAGFDDAGLDDEGLDGDRPGAPGPRRGGRVRWGVGPRAAVALGVVAVLAAGGLVLRGALSQPGDAVQAAIDPAVAAVPAIPVTAVDEASGAGGVDPAAIAPGQPAPGGAAPAPVQGPLEVHVVGAVKAPGVVQVPAGSRVVDAVAAAGGLSPEADPAGVNLARPLADGEQVVVSRPGEVPAAPAGTPVPGGPSTGGPPGEAGAPGALVDVNTAGTAELDALPGIGPVLAQRIVDFRETNGPYAGVDELVEVPGIGDAVLANLSPLVRV